MLKRQTSCFIRKTAAPHTKKDKSVLLVRGTSIQRRNTQSTKPYKSDLLKRNIPEDALMKTQIRPFFSSKMRNVQNPEEINETWQRAALAFAQDDTASETTSIENMLPRRNKEPVATRKRAIGIIECTKRR